jgi:hypothetical protein
MTQKRNTRGRRSPTLISQVEKSVFPNAKNYSIDLRVHAPQALSAKNIDGIKTAPAVVKLAEVKGLDMIGVTDFYSTCFIDEMKAAAKNSKLVVIPGIDIRCSIANCPDVEFSCFFSEECDAVDLNNFIDDLGIPENYYGDNLYTILRPFSEVLECLEKFSGEILPMRIDLTPSRIGVIKFLVEEFGFRSFDLAYVESIKIFEENWPHLKFNLFNFSNANALAQVGSRMVKVSLESLNFESLRSVIHRDVVELN